MRKCNVRILMKVRQSIRAISPVISVLLMITIAVVASLVVYSWVTGYIDGTTTNTGKAIQIQSLAKNPENKLVVYVQNFGQGPVQFDASSCAYVNGKMESCQISTGNNPLGEGQTATFTTNYVVELDSSIKIKIVTLDGRFAEMTNTKTLSTTSTLGYGLFGDGFDSVDFSQWTSTTGSPTLETAIKHHGTYGCLFTDYTCWLEKNLASTYSDIYCRAYIMITEYPSYADGNGEYFMCLYDAGWSEFVGFGLKTDGSGNHFWNVYTPTSGIVSYDSTINLNQWYCVEIRRTAGAGDGVVQVWVDGILICDLQTLTLNTDVKNIAIGYFYGPTWVTNDLYVDCIVVSDNYIGP